MQAWVQGAIAKISSTVDSVPSSTPNPITGPSTFMPISINTGTFPGTLVLPRYIRAAQRNVDASIQKPQPSIPGKAKDFISGVKPMPGGQVGAGVKGSEEGPSKWSRIGSGNVDQGYTYEELSLGGANVKYVEYCPLESENFVPCFNVSENLDLGLSKGDEVYRLMMLEEEQISFRSDFAMFDSIEDYSHQIAEMIGLQAGNVMLTGIRKVFFIIIKGLDIESPYYRPLQACIAGMQRRRWIPIEERTKWPSRAKLNSNELKVQGDGYEAFLTYPRSYDLLHANGLLSLEFGQHSRCTMCDLFIEMDRVLRLESVPRMLHCASYPEGPPANPRLVPAVSTES
ncbi:hypothetical protein FXO37_01867 [Capsicum annuum]|nr:hypothetical protein FXO37_01867 [Capsicum annuum]